MTADLPRSCERDWIFARRFVIRRMIERGDPSSADLIPEIPEYGELADEIEALRMLLYQAITSTDDDEADYGVFLDHINGTAHMRAEQR